MTLARLRLLVLALVAALVAVLVTPVTAEGATHGAVPAVAAPHLNTVVTAKRVGAEQQKLLVQRESAIGRLPVRLRREARRAFAAGASAAAPVGPPVKAAGAPVRVASYSSWVPANGQPGEMVWGMSWDMSARPSPLTFTVTRASDGAVVVSRSVTWTQVSGGFIETGRPGPIFNTPDQASCLGAFRCGIYFVGAPFVAGAQYRISLLTQDGTFTSPTTTAYLYSSIPGSLAGYCTCAYQQHRGDPVNTGTGALTESVTDAKLPGAGVTFALERHYRSDTDRVGLLGRGWSTSLEANLVAGTNTQTLVDADGSRITFTRNADGTYTAPDPVRYTLTQSGGTFTVKALDQTSRRFDSTGRLTGIVDAGGAGLTLAYDANGLATVTDAAGRAVAMTVSGGRLTKATLPDGRFVQFGYTGTLLTSVRGLNAGTATYGYDAGNRLNRVTDPRNNTATTTYDATSGRVVSQVDRAGQTTTFTWDAANAISTMTDPKGGVWTDDYSGGALMSHSDPLGHVTSRTYDPDLNVLSETDANGGTTSMTYDSRGNMLTRTYADGTDEAWTYDAADNVRSHTDGRDTVTNYTYDTSNRLTQVVTPVGTTKLTYTAKGQVETTVQPSGRTTTNGYDAAGNLTSQTSPSGAKTTFGYDAAGHRTSLTEPRGNVSGANAADFTTTFTYTPDDLVDVLTDPLGHTANNDYDLNGNQTSTVDAAGGTSSVVYDAMNRPTTATDQLGKTTVTAYDANGNVQSVTDQLGGVTTFGYDAANRRISATSPRGNVSGAPAGSYTTTYGYDSADNQTSETDPTGAVTKTSYDSLNRPRVVTDPLNKTTTTTYDANGNPTSVVDRAGKETKRTYDAVNRLATTTDPLTKVTTYGYDVDGRQTSVTTPRGYVTKWTYDPDGRVKTVIDPRGNVSGGTPANYTTTYGYDPAGNRTTVTDALGKVTTTTYDALNHPTSVKDPLNRTTSRAYDALGRVTSVTDPATAVTSFGYDAVGNLKTRTDAKNHVTTYEYDAARQLKKITDPLSRVRSFSYDEDGNPRTAVNGRGATTTYTTNGRGEVTAVAYSDSTAPLAFAYDGNGNRTTITDATGTRTLTYDNEERLLTVSVPGATTKFAYTYNANGDILTRTFPDGRATTYTYDDDRRRISHALAGRTTTFTWDEADNLRTIKYPATNGNTETRTYDRVGRLTKVDDKNPTSGTVLASWQLTLDEAGQPRRVDVARAGLTAGSQTYTYDADGRILTGCTPSVTTAAGCPSGSTITYTYDAVGNRATSTTGGVTTTYTYDAADQLKTTTAGTTTTSYTYDADGNQTGDGTRTFTYDAGNHLTGINSTTTNVFVNDADGNRVTVNQNGSLFRTQWWDINGDGGLPQLATYTGATGNLYGDYQTAPDGTPLTLQTGTADFYLHHDWLGSITDVTDSAGVNQWRNGYDPFGVRVQSKLVSSAPTEPFGFTGAWTDPYVANRTYLRARELDGPTGRFTQPDPVELRPGDPFESDYTYAGNAPTYRTDPTGLCSAGALLKSIGGMFQGKFGLQDACTQQDMALSQDHNLLTAGSSSLLANADDVVLAFGQGVGNLGKGFFAGFLAPWTVFTTDSDSTCYRVGAGAGGGFGAAYLIRDILGLAPGGVTGAGAGRHVAAGGGRVFTSKDAYVGELATAIDRKFPGRVVDINNDIHMNNGFLREVDIDLGHVVIQVKEGKHSGRIMKQMEETMERTGRVVLGYAPDLKPGAAREAARRGLHIARTEEEMMDLLRRFS